jgi:AraC-like DNA-binding protein
LRHAHGPVRTFGLDVGPVAFVPPHVAGWSYLITLRAGAATVRCSAAAALVTSSVAVWVPAGERFALESHGRCSVRIAYLADGFVARRPFGAVDLTPLLGELIERAVVSGYLDPACERDARLLAVIDDELRALRPAAAAFAFVLPRSRELRTVAERALRSSGEPASIVALAAETGMSPRTFERAFLRETGVSPRTWFRHARLCVAAAALATGASVTEAGLLAGYASLSAFISAFRRAFERTPGRSAATAIGPAPRSA